MEWIGEIPEGWGVVKLKYLVEANPSNIDKKSKDDEEEVFLCNYVDVYKNEFISNELDFMKATASKKQIDKFILKKGDVIATKDSETPDDIGNPAFVIDDLNEVVCGYHLTHIKPLKISGYYLFRLFQCKYLQSYFGVSANGITRFGLGVDKFNSALILKPPLPEQNSIATFLDNRTHLLDTLITKKQRQVELLKELRAALITRAVTKGLDPDVKMKDSGIEWLGEIPEGWDVKKCRYIYRQLRLTPQSDADIITVYRDGEVTLRKKRRAEGYTIAIMELGYQGIRNGDLVIHSMDAFAGSIGVSDSDGKSTGEYVVCEPIQQGTCNNYYASLLRIMADRGSRL